MFTALVALREVFVWRIGLGEGQEGEGGACEGKEMAYVLCLGGVRGYVDRQSDAGKKNQPFLLAQDHVFGGPCGMRTKLGLRRSPP